MTPATPHSTIDDYIRSADPDVQTILREIRRVARAAVPDATETISYRMPALKTRRVFFYFAAFRKHIGIYPPVVDDAALRAELAPYANAKGNLSFPLSSPMPYELIGLIAAALAAQHAD